MDKPNLERLVDKVRNYNLLSKHHTNLIEHNARLHDIGSRILHNIKIYQNSTTLRNANGGDVNFANNMGVVEEDPTYKKYTDLLDILRKVAPNSDLTFKYWSRVLTIFQKLLDRKMTEEEYHSLTGEPEFYKRALIYANFRGIVRYLTLGLSGSHEPRGIFTMGEWGE